MSTAEEWEESLLHHTWNTPRYAIIPSKPQTPERLELLDQSVQAIAPQVDQVLVIDNTPDRIIGLRAVPELLDNVAVIADPISPVNLSYLWNVGLRFARRLAREANADTGRESWDVAIINDDAIVPDGWFTAVSDAMREQGAAAGCSGGGPHSRMLTQPGAVPLETRMTGWAFILAGEKGATANEQLLWWFGDDHLDWLSRQLGGMLMIPGYPVQHLTANNQMTPELHAQTGKDAATFKAYWGSLPW